jgi:predicted 3-demethylubiquinone-9 3-methyltransferase (glyoxalase superfamily)
MREIAPCLWFDTEGEEAANFYTSVFPNSRIVNVTHYGPAGPREEGMVLTVEFELNGHKLIALNGGPEFTFSEAVSLHVSCESQEEVDAYWSALSEGGEEGPCGWQRTGSASHGRSTPSDSRTSWPILTPLVRSARCGRC